MTNRREWISFDDEANERTNVLRCTLILIPNRNFTVYVRVGVRVRIGVELNRNVCHSQTNNNRLFIHFYYAFSRPFLFIVCTSLWAFSF